jgi:hypothetical protein
MSWVKDALNSLGKTGVAEVRPHGGSMRGRIESGQLVTLVLASLEDVVKGDIVFVKWKGNYLLHLVLDKTGSEILIGNNLGKTNGWASAEAVLAKVVQVRD